MRRALIASIAIVLALASAPTASAASGDIDASFGSEGVAFGFAGPESFSQDVTVLADGHLMLVGFSASEDQPFFGIAASGSTFSADGALLGGFGTARGVLSAYVEVVPDPAGGALIAGWAERCLAGTSLQNCTRFSRGLFMIVKVHADGSPDTSFDDDGVVLTALGAGGASAEGIALQPDGKIVVAGSAVDRAGNPLLAIVRYRTDGSLDPTFGNRGRVLLPGGTAVDVAIDSLGRIVVAGEAAPDFLVVRLLPAGAIDLSFGQQGRTRSGFVNRSAKASDLALSSGKILVGGGVVTQLADGSSKVGFALMRFTRAGTLDPTFDVDGKAITTFTQGDAGLAELAVTNSGKIVAAGGPGVARYTSAGRRDLSFSGDGRVWMTDPFTSQLMLARGLVLQGAKPLLAVDDEDAMAATRLLP